MPVLLVDLDNTLVDRAAAFATFAHDFVAEFGRDPSEAEWLIKIDEDGFAPREAVAKAIRERFGLTDHDRDSVLTTIRAGLIERCAGVLSRQAKQHLRTFRWRPQETQTNCGPTSTKPAAKAASRSAPSS